MTVTLPDAFAWTVGVGALLSLIACIALRDLLAGTVPEAQIRGLLPGDVLWQSGVDPTTGRRVNSVEAQRAQWLALAASTLTLFLYCRPVAWWVESWTAPGVAWIGNLVGGALSAMFALDGLIYSLTSDRARRLVAANRTFALTCIAVIITPWIINHPEPRSALLDDFVNYYQPTWSSFVSVLGMAIYLPTTCLFLAVRSWRAASDEHETMFRTSLRLIAVGAGLALSIVANQLVQSLSWTLGHPVWSEEQGALVQLACTFATSTFLTLGCAWAPLTYKRRVRANRFLMPLYEDDVRALRPMWRLLGGGTFGTSYEFAHDQVTATTPTGLDEQRQRLAMELLDVVPWLGQYLSPAGRRRAEQDAGGSVTLTLRHRILRVMAPLLCAVVPDVGRVAPERAAKLWRWATERPLEPFSRGDAACIRAATKMASSQVGPVEEGTPVLTPTLEKTEVVGYLRQLIQADRDRTVRQAAAGAHALMLAEALSEDDLSANPSA